MPLVPVGSGLPEPILQWYNAAHTTQRFWVRIQGATGSSAAALKKCLTLPRYHPTPSPRITEQEWSGLPLFLPGGLLMGTNITGAPRYTQSPHRARTAARAPSGALGGGVRGGGNNSAGVGVWGCGEVCTGGGGGGGRGVEPVSQAAGCRWCCLVCQTLGKPQGDSITRRSKLDQTLRGDRLRLYVGGLRGMLCTKPPPPPVPCGIHMLLLGDTQGKPREGEGGGGRTTTDDHQ